MLTRFMYLKENSKFFIVASIICLLIILAVITSLPGSPQSNENGGYWAQIIGNIR